MNAPAASLTSFLALPLPLDSTMAASGTNAPSGSVTVPAIAPVGPCASNGFVPIGSSRPAIHKLKTNRSAIFIVILEALIRAYPEDRIPIARAPSLRHAV
jgi:hypothetical protein